MKKRDRKTAHLGRSISLGWFLAYRQVKRSSVATTLLIVFVMMLTFLNLVVMRGVLVGLIQGSTDVYKKNYAGDIIISPLAKKEYIENTSYAWPFYGGPKEDGLDFFGKNRSQ